jgi:hypothetical protein
LAEAGERDQPRASVLETAATSDFVAVDPRQTDVDDGDVRSSALQQADTGQSTAVSTEWSQAPMTPTIISRPS